MAVNVFQYHDRIIHHQTDGEYHRQQRHQVPGETHCLHHHRDTNQRQRNGDDRNDNGAERTKEQRDHHQYDHGRFDDGFDDLVNRFVDRYRRVIHHVHRDVAWHVAFQFRQNVEHIFRDVDRVSTWCGVNRCNHRFLTVRTRAVGIVALGQSYVGDVAQASDTAIFVFHHQIFQFIDVRYLSIRAAVKQHEFAYRLTGGRLVVVRAQYAHDIGGRQVESRHLGRIQPHAQGVFHPTVQVDAGNTVNRVQLRVDHALQVIGDLA